MSSSNASPEEVDFGQQTGRLIRPRSLWGRGFLLKKATGLLSGGFLSD